MEEGWRRVGGGWEDGGWEDRVGGGWEDRVGGGLEEGWRRVGGRVVEEEGWRRVGGGFEDGWRRVGATGLAEGGRTGLEEGCWPVRLCARKGAVRGNKGGAAQGKG